MDALKKEYYSALRDAFTRRIAIGEPKYARLFTGDVLTPFGQNYKPSSKLFFI